MAIAPNQPITLAEFLQLPETKPACEYIESNCCSSIWLVKSWEVIMLFLRTLIR